MSFHVTTQPNNHQFEVETGKTVLDAALDAGLTLPYGCRNGACGACKGKVLQGEVEHGKHQGQALSDAEKQAGKALFCCATPLSDLTIECREIGTRGIQPKIMPCRVQKIERLTHDVIALYLKLPTNERLQFFAGQYIEFLLKDGKRRAFSLANAPHDDELLEVHVRHVPGGQFTEFVFNELQEKAILRIEGPLGSFYLREESDRPIVFVAGGTGFAPIRGIVEHALHLGIKREMVMYWGAQSLNDLYMHALPPRWAAAHANFKYIPVLSGPLPEDNWTGRVGLVHEAVLADFANLAEYEVYCCGAPQMVETAHASFTAAGLPEGEFFSDAFTFAPKGK